MNIFDLWSVILLFLIAYGGLQLLRFILFFIYVFQLKEYRLDRFFAHLKTYTGIKDLIDNFNLLKLKKYYFPKLTVKVILCLILIFFFQYNFIFIILSLVFSFFLPFPGAILLAILFVLVVTTFLVPIFVLVSFFIIDFFCIPIKEIIFNLAANKIIKRENLLVIGITGSYGKTSTKEIIESLLKEKFQVIATPKNCNTKLGISIFILKSLWKKHEIFIVEMGAYKIGEIKEICQITRPKIGIVTGINEQHQALFGSIKNTIKAKYELIRFLPRDGVAFFNARNKYSLSMSKKRKIKKYLYGNNKLGIKLNMLQELYAENLKAGFVLAKSLGLKKNYLIKRLNKIKARHFKIKLLKIKRGVKIIDDTYSSNPNGFLAVLEFSKKVRARKKILVTPGIIELGKSANKIHQILGRKSANTFDFIFFTKKDFIKPFSLGVTETNTNICVKFEENIDSLTKKLKKFKKMGYLVVLEGRLNDKIKKMLIS